MSPWLYALLAAGVVWIAGALFVLFAAFRTHVAWGLVVIFVPFGYLIFAVTHWSDAGVRFLVSLVGYFGFLSILLTHWYLVAPYLQPSDAQIGTKLHLPSAAVEEPSAPDAAQGKVEAAALAEAQLAKRDELLDREAAYTRHAAEVNAMYAQLTAARAKLKGPGPAMVAFNAKAAQYQQNLTSLQAEKASYDALQRTVQTADLAARSGTQRVANLLKAPSTTDAGKPEPPVTRADLDAAVARIRAIVNQVPPPVSKPPGETGWIEGFHAGASRPDFDKTDIVSGRQPYTVAYIQMEGSPNVFYRGADCEFNSQTKFFYTHRELPKKKLSDAEYQELVRLYRFIGKCQRDLNVSL